MMNAIGIYAFRQSHRSDLGEEKLRNRRDRTMWKFFAAAVGSGVALAAFAGAANASATIDLIWGATGTDTLSELPSSTIRLKVFLTAGPNGSLGAGVSVDYSEVLGVFVVTQFANKLNLVNLPLTLMPAIDTGSRVENINSTSWPEQHWGIGLPAGASVRLGTITFMPPQMGIGLPASFEIRSDANAPTNGVLDLIGGEITATTTFNSAFVSLPEPSALTALGSGIAMLAFLYRRHRHLATVEID